MIDKFKKIHFSLSCHCQYAILIAKCETHLRSYSRKQSLRSIVTLSQYSGNRKPKVFELISFAYQKCRWGWEESHNILFESLQQLKQSQVRLSRRRNAPPKLQRKM